MEYLYSKNFASLGSLKSKDNYFFAISVLIFLLSYFYVLNYTNYPEYQIFSEFAAFVRNSVLFGAAVLAGYVAKRLVTERPAQSPTKFCLNVIANEVFDTENRWRILTSVIGLSLVLSAFYMVKLSIPKVVPFSYDSYFEELDRVIHFGYQPWALLQPLLGHTWVTLVIHKLYYLWFPVIFLVFFQQMASRNDDKLRLQFMLSFIASWAIIGGLMATVFSSAGPIYFDRIIPGSPQTYAEAALYLESINETHQMTMFMVKEALWSSYVGQEVDGIAKGISAMPSMHVAISFLLALFGWRKGMWWGIGFSLFALVIFLGSIHLLWHYAVDGYVSIVATSVIWLVCGKVSKIEQRKIAHERMLQAAE